MTHTLTLQSISPVTRDTHHLVFDKPEGFAFTPGQAVDLSLDKDGWREEKRPFTFTSLPDEDTLQFVIKSYPEHDGVTEQIGKLQAGDKVLIEDPWGAIEDKGDGIFIAGGAGVTPFIAILRKKLQDKGTLEGNTLVFSNQTEADIILKDEFDAMPGLAVVYTVTDEPDSGYARGQVDASFLKDLVEVKGDVVYVCGPDGMVEALPREVAELGVPKDHVVTEEFD
ncbi:FAD-binding oxidoreductase [Sagittula stellata]|uniref:Putative oxidoreductase n=1 Tax=Sagittula stellata (strain ATCC 700073 / DSM 11524 / E-37) TaxID=388399 RepID=A3K589_SAGS3|nr:FAD-binding oxidoreductase [Sagittula stellata]EBA07690.1 putative oxidoreductase [Sagittula stellata E-37]